MGGSLISKISIEKFRAMSNLEIPLGTPIVAIAGQNGVQKSSLLGMIAQPFSLRGKDGAMPNAKTLTGHAFGTDIRTKFRFSKTFDIPGEHRWSVTLSKEGESDKTVRCVSSRRTKGDGCWRFSDPSKKKGTGYIYFPTVYLSLKRLLPLGEVKNVNKGRVNLEKGEKSFLVTCHNEILLVSSKAEDVQALGSGQKQTVGVSTKNCDAETMSAGQDNIGEILLAVMSFIRLKKKFPQSYQGGLIAIDELDASLFPASQIKMIDKMIEWAKAYNIQFVFTTHSETLLKTLSLDKYRRYSTTIYLHREKRAIKAYTNPTHDEMCADLMAGIGSVPNKIRLYVEDDVTLSFVDELLSEEQKQQFEILRGVSLGAGTYRDLFDEQVYEFISNIIILDGDMEGEGKSSLFENREPYYNFVCLPGRTYPEKLLYKFFSDLEEEDDFWETKLGGYNKQKCFRDVPARSASSKSQIKKWFANQDNLRVDGKRLLIRRWIKEIPDDVARFRKEVHDAVEHVRTRVR